jgi:hypothetical protein
VAAEARVRGARMAKREERDSIQFSMPGLAPPGRESFLDSGLIFA